MSELNPVEMIFKLVVVLKKKMNHRIDVIDMDACLTPMHVQVLKHIGANQGVTANAIATELVRDKAQVTRLLNTLTKETLIEKQANPNDKRSQLIVCTDKGLALYQQIEGIDQFVLARLAEGLSHEELAEFQRLAEKMLLNLEMLEEAGVS